MGCRSLFFLWPATRCKGSAMSIQLVPTTSEYSLSCAEFAALNQVRPETVRERICRTGSYFGIRPRKLANRRLLFPAVQAVVDAGSVAA